MKCNENKKSIAQIKFSIAQIILSKEFYQMIFLSILTPQLTTVFLGKIIFLKTVLICYFHTSTPLVDSRFMLFINWASFGFFTSQHATQLQGLLAAVWKSLLSSWESFFDNFTADFEEIGQLQDMLFPQSLHILHFLDQLLS